MIACNVIACTLQAITVTCDILVSTIKFISLLITSNIFSGLTDLVAILLSIIVLSIPDRFSSLRRVSGCRISHALSHYWARFFSFTRRAPERLFPNILFPAKKIFVYLQVLFCIRTLEISRSLPSHITPWLGRVSAHNHHPPPSRHFPRDHSLRFPRVCGLGARG